MLSPTDEFADFETLQLGNLNLTVVKEDWMLEHEYAREALKNGLQDGRLTRHQPYKFGMVGSSDTHTALAAVEEDNYFGKHAGTEPSPGSLESPDGEVRRTASTTAGRCRPPATPGLGHREHAGRRSGTP